MPEQFNPAWEYYTADPEVEEVLIESTPDRSDRIDMAIDSRTGRFGMTGMAVMSHPDRYRSRWPVRREFIKEARPDRKCKQCGCLFHPRNDESKYCSALCFGLTRRVNNPQRACKACGRVFYNRLAWVKYCSAVCVSNGKELLLKTERKCGSCGESFHSRFNDKRFCSLTCRDKATPRKTFFGRRVCEWCRGEYNAKTEKARFCSLRCSGLFSRQKRVDSINPGENLSDSS